MAIELPRFNEAFLETLPQDGVERQFVSAVDTAIFELGRKATMVGRVEHNLRLPFAENRYGSKTELNARMKSFSGEFEDELDRHGLYEIIFSVQSLKTATTALKGRLIQWTPGQPQGDKASTATKGYLINSAIGFLYDFPPSPALLLEVAESPNDETGQRVSLPRMWDIQIDTLE